MTSAVIRELSSHDPMTMHAAFDALGWNKPVSLFERYLDEHTAGSRYCVLAEFDGDFCGYVTLAWTSAYPPFAELRIPEISDLNVLPAYRRRGIASALLDHVESMARQRSPMVGLGVGLYADYGSAQRLYVRRGYLPDGNGVMYDNEPVPPGDLVRLDDDATLMFIKRFDQVG
ncbi:MAG: GNAT family N-acetyltransferase [Microbacterium sp.]|nr:GNAT family N-acetyltransferase [Microbacterium sp.]